MSDSESSMRSGVQTSLVPGCDLGQDKLTFQGTGLYWVTVQLLATRLQYESCIHVHGSIIGESMASSCSQQLYAVVLQCCLYFMGLLPKIWMTS